ncbi:Aste57867_12870 [Aphanomyces stellatus]|uniref:Aste57867_12870 protein n=1 Tax=Aphanomyces stellatus TaxID=120398 RepID=A0A485KYB1_9STRA|nr:hypothetical protein As57867_012822 [Aphanomyces stellatus]VFT89717.1 Aste57867_12870 [Aphanomyces stellatus]
MTLTLKAGAVHTYSTGSFLSSPQWKPCHGVLTSAATLCLDKNESGRPDMILDLSICGMDALEIMPWAAMQTATGPQWRLALTTPATGRVFIALDSESDMDAWIVALSSVLVSHDRSSDRQRPRYDADQPAEEVC